MVEVVNIWHENLSNSTFALALELIHRGPVTISIHSEISIRLSLKSLDDRCHEEDGVIETWNEVGLVVVVVVASDGHSRNDGSHISLYIVHMNDTLRSQDGLHDVALL